MEELRAYVARFVAVLKCILYLWGSGFVQLSCLHKKMLCVLPDVNVIDFDTERFL